MIHTLLIDYVQQISFKTLPYSDEQGSQMDHIHWKVQVKKLINNLHIYELKLLS